MTSKREQKKPVKSRRIIYGSLREWALVSFVVVALPLVVAIIYTMSEITSYTVKSQKILVQTVQAAEISRTTLNRLILMEQSIRQFEVLNDAAIFDSYLQHRKSFLEMISILQGLSQEAAFNAQVTALLQAESLLNQDILHSAKQESANLVNVHLKQFDRLTNQARELVAAGEQKVGVEARALSDLAGRIHEHLIFSTFVSISMALLLALVFVYLLTLPIKKIALAIRHLGEEGFERPIAIGGPKDLTELGVHLEWLRKRLNQLEYEKLQFIRTISHELKTPLATLKEGTNLLAEDIVGELNTEQQEIIQLMHMSNITLNDLIDNLLEYQRTMVSQIDLNLSTFAVDKLIERCLNEYQLPLRSKNISVQSKLGLTHIDADYGKLEIIISNLFSNALKFSPKNGKIGISLFVRNNDVQLLIEDQGPGIAKDIEPFIFEDFYQGNSPQIWQIKGTGLGLSLVKYYLDVHKGEIKLLPASNEYCGARFLLHLPQKQDAFDATLS
ncbi:MAG: HAMP domain-containing sensor histidine kinase [Methyloprofundus sp.]|nr:HAMP domain-containing sensor histidine kinase [Methyloprofundus sp.]MDT8424472.1 HAMP domain-containing sensor histidine kinase [Methyloprofundus sp.]